MVIWLFNFTKSNCGIKHILIYHSPTNIYHIQFIHVFNFGSIPSPRRSASPNKGSGSLRGCVSGTWRVTTRYQAVTKIHQFWLVGLEHVFFLGNVIQRWRVVHDFSELEHQINGTSSVSWEILSEWINYKWRFFQHGWWGLLIMRDLTTKSVLNYKNRWCTLIYSNWDW